MCFELISDVTKYVAWLNSLYDATEPLAAVQDDVKDYEIKLDDIRMIMENTMETLFSYDSLYNGINGTFAEAKNYCTRIGMLHDETNETITEGKNLVDEAQGLLVDAESNIQVNRYFNFFLNQFLIVIIIRKINIDEETDDMYKKL